MPEQDRWQLELSEYIRQGAQREGVEVHAGAGQMAARIK